MNAHRCIWFDEGDVLVCSCGAAAVRLVDDTGDEVVAVLADVVGRVAVPA